MPESCFGFFDPQTEHSVIERRLPHWSQPGALAFITFRTHDSMPKHIVEEWLAEKTRLLIANGIDPSADDGKIELTKLSQSVATRIQNQLSDRWHQQLDACHGLCVLRQPQLSLIVADSLQKFDGDRYELTDYVIMPNHVHLIAAFPEEASMLKQCESWKHYTAREINKQLGNLGRFWQQDGFDHLIRSEEQLRYLRKYIWSNPDKAGLAAESCRRYSRAIEGLNE